MATEIERKFLVKNDKWRDHVVSESILKQGYLSSSPEATVRVRITSEGSQLTIKSKTSGISRSEFEYSIPQEDAEAMLQGLAERPYIEKTRYKVACGQHVWDLDVFAGENQGLVMAEVELSREDETFEMPDWAGEEVSDDRRYYNSSLVKLPYSRW